MGTILLDEVLNEFITLSKGGVFTMPLVVTVNHEPKYIFVRSQQLELAIAHLLESL
jgi:hypothetical protein